VHLAAPESPSRRFIVTNGLRILTFDDEAVVFDPLSWDAHLLNSAAIAVLELLQDEPRTEREVTAFLEDALQPKEQPRAAEHARQLLVELATLGLVHGDRPEPDALR